MNNKVIAGVSALALLVTMTAAFAGSGSAPFTIEIIVDTTIFIPTIIDNCGAGIYDGALEFEPGITGLDHAYATAIDTCASGTVGDWNITMAGNVALDLDFKLNNDSPQGVTIALWGNDAGATPDGTFTNNANYFNLTADDFNPTWAQGITDADALELWQRVAANTTAIGGNIYLESIVVTSSQAI